MSRKNIKKLPGSRLGLIGIAVIIMLLSFYPLLSFVIAYISYFPRLKAKLEKYQDSRAVVWGY